MDSSPWMVDSAPELRLTVRSGLMPSKVRPVALTMCRDLYVLERGALVSKTAAASWAARRLGPPWAHLVERTLGWRADERPDDRQLPETRRFLAHAVELARSVG